MAHHDRIPAVLRLAACSLLLGLGACSTSFDWQRVDAGAVPFEDAWGAMVDVAQVDGYPLDTTQSDRGRKVFVSRWRARELPFRLGSRKRVHAEFEEIDGRWEIRYCVEQQVISNFARAFDPADEDWKGSGQDRDTERRFAVKLNGRFREATASSQPR